MSDVVIKVENLTKTFKLYNHPRDRLKEALSLSRKKYHHEYKALNNLSFEIKKGTSVGIIGRNGAGKSTLLKIITGVLTPTAGNVQVQGKIAALLELGSGFNPELSGLENIFFQGAIMGFTKEEMEEKIQVIVDFADIGEFINQPVKTYSSGMFARLAFSIAINVDPDILIVDEALSVGDLGFQSKCMQRMQMLLDSKVTVLFVSHSLNQVRQFCQQALYVCQGELESFGEASRVCDIYQNSLVENSKPSLENILIAKNGHRKFRQDPGLRDNSVMESSGTMEVVFTAFEILNMEKNEIFSVSAGERIIFKTYLKANANVPAGASIGLLIGDKTGYPLLSCNSNLYEKYLPAMKKGTTATVEWSLVLPFYSGEFRIDIGLKSDIYVANFYDRVFCAKTLRVEPPTHLQRKNFGSLLYVDAEVLIETEID